MSLNLDAPLLWLVYTCKEPRLSGILCYTFWTSQVALVVKIPPVNAGDTRATGSIPGLGWPPREGSVNPLQYSWLKNYMDRGTWQAAVLEVTKSLIWLNNWAQHSTHTHTPIHTHIKLNHFAVHLKLTQCCKSIVLQYKSKVITCSTSRTTHSTGNEPQWTGTTFHPLSQTSCLRKGKAIAHNEGALCRWQWKEL